MTNKPGAGTKGKVAGLDVRLMAVQVLQSVLKGGSFEPLGEKQIADSRDRALANRLVTTALGRHGHLDKIIAASLDKGLPQRSGLFEAALRVGLSELLFLDGADHSAIFVAVEIIRGDRRAGRFAKLANAVLRQAQRDRDKWLSLAAADALPGAVRQRWSQLYDGKTISHFGEALLAGPDLDLTVRSDAAGWAERLGGVVLNDQSVRIENRDKRVAELAGYTEGQWWVQDFAAALPARMITAPGGASVLDLCTAPGGKSAQLAARGYDVIAVDVDDKRMGRVAENLARLDLEAQLIVADALSFDDGRRFDAILLDAPCSATGTFRRHPEVLLNRTAKDIAEMAALQAGLIDHALGLLNPGGELVYCTCSLEPEEGESQVAAALSRHQDLAVAPISEDGPWSGIGAVTGAGWLRTHPGLCVGNRRGMDGFFAVRFKFA
ncbi:MAG: RsmB/NOP family class I SAM-dependent RNA methyltransferase [Hyphomicrobiaceae bacterium]|nr:RsmB/NOP family class I SAM-dependent RNA methyltransferase [Hyphomicrobiaceae bacterium]MCC0024988.1 RsmB/NOP family class I SAM-dependent RNA methyltransferase [Hyphomicrobiaceae bacterium]